MHPIEALPEELIINVFEHLSQAAPSQVRARDEPGIGLTSSEQKDLKHVSMVCKPWRRVVLPILFRHAQFRLDGMEIRPRTCALCSSDTIQERARSRTQAIKPIMDCDQYHSDMIDDAVEHLKRAVDGNAHIPHVLADDEIFTNIITWLPRFYHDLQSFLNFVTKHNLTRKISSFVLLTEQMLQKQLCRFPHHAANHEDWRWRATAAFWQHLLSDINPQRISILAPPVDLACLTLSSTDALGEWAFENMEYHLLTLEHEDMQQPKTYHPIDYSSLSYLPLSLPSVASSSLFNLRPWTSASLNEGSFLEAYGIYGTERGPPSVIHSISPLIPQQRPSLTPTTCAFWGPKHIKKFTYTALFPSAVHLDLSGLLGQIEILDLQLAPHPSSTLLSDEVRVGRAELDYGCSELIQAYEAVVVQVATSNITATKVPHLKSLICRDHYVSLSLLRVQLDDVFTPLCLPVWAEYSPGVFTRLAPEMKMPLG